MTGGGICNCSVCREAQARALAYQGPRIVIEAPSVSLTGEYMREIACLRFAAERAQRQLEAFAPYAHGVVKSVMLNVAKQLGEALAEQASSEEEAQTRKAYPVVGGPPVLTEDSVRFEFDKYFEKDVEEE